MGSKAVEAVWVLVCFLACATAYAFFQVPYVSMPAEMTSSYDERTRLMTWRVAILAFTIMLAGATAPMIRDAVGGRAGYRVMGVAMAVVIVVGVVSAYVGTRHAPVGAVEPGAGSLRDQLRIVAGARDFRLLLTTFVVQALATGCMLAGVDYLASDVLGKKGAATILFVCFVAPALLLTPAWSALGARFGKKQGYLVSSVILAAGALLVVSGAHRAERSWSSSATALVGVGYAGAQVFPLAMLPDAAAVDARRTGSGRVGVYTGVWTAGETLGLALGPGLFAVVLAIGGYRSSTDGDVAQPDSALTAITLGFSVLPAALVLLSLVWLVRYSLTSRPRSTTTSGGGHHMTDVLERLRALQADDLPVHGGRTLAYVYDSGLPDIDRIGREAVAACGRDQRPRPDRVPEPAADGERPGRRSGCGCSTRPDTGGRDRDLRRHRVGAARGAGRARRAARGRPRPAMVLPVHRARGVRQGRALLRRREADRPGRAPTSARTSTPTAAAIDELGDRVVLVVASAPSYAHGVIDPVPELAALAAARGIRCHVDACIGGWVLPYAARLGRPVPPWTFAVDGRHLDLGRPAQVRLRAQGHLAAPAPHAGAAPAAVLRLGGLARLHDAQLDDAVDEVRRAAGRRLGGGRVARRRGLPEPSPGRCSRRSTRSWPGSQASPSLVAGRPPRLVAGRASRPTAAATRSRSATRCSSAGWYVQPQMSYAGHGPSIHLSVSAGTLAHVDGVPGGAAASRWRPRRRRAGHASTPASRRTSSRSTRPR